MGAPSWLWLVGGAGALLLFSSRAAATARTSSGFSQEGVASFYGPGFDGRQTANQEIFDQNAMTAAHRTLPFNTKVLVTDLETGNQVAVRINDRGPFAKNKDGSINTSRIIDLSMGAARQLGIIDRGLANVRLESV